MNLVLNPAETAAPPDEPAFDHREYFRHSLEQTFGLLWVASLKCRHNLWHWQMKRRLRNAPVHW
jgi:hypothetical protein